MNKNLSYKELKSLVSVIDVATYLGYQFDRSKGVAQPSYVLSTPGGDEIDRIYIKNPRDYAIQGYWRRSSIKGGDVISFVKENLDKFNVTGFNDIDKTNKILHNFANRTYNAPVQDTTYRHIFEKATFEPNRWMNVNNSYVRDKILSTRNIDRSTSLTFANHILTIQDRKSKTDYINLGFPYTIPGSKDIVGYEIRGVSGFKSKATGTDSTNGMWIADFTRNPLEVKNLFIGESAYDLLSYYQLNHNNIDLFSSVFVSFGGAFSDRQYQNLIDHYNTCKPTLLFDNDLYGKMYDIRAFALSSGKEIEAKLDDAQNVHFKVDDKDFSIPAAVLSLTKFLDESKLRNNGMVEVIKPNSPEVKDWNEVLSIELNTQSKYALGR